MVCLHFELQEAEKAEKNVMNVDQTEISINVTVIKGEISVEKTDNKGIVTASGKVHIMSVTMIYIYSTCLGVYIG